MTKGIHFIVVGNEDVTKHLAGIPQFRADEVVLFVSEDNQKVSRIIENLKEMGVSYRTIKIKDDYISSYRRANEEAAASFTDNSFIAINLSAGSRTVLSGIEDAVRIQLYYFHRRNLHGSPCSAFRYVIEQKKHSVLKIAPIWNFQVEMQNDIFEALAETKEPFTQNNIWELISNAKMDVGGYEAFRKIFRDFKRWFRCSPCFKEGIRKGPEYKIDLST
jgi:hypothetical protein